MSHIPCFRFCASFLPSRNFLSPVPLNHGGHAYGYLSHAFILLFFCSSLLLFAVVCCCYCCCSCGCCCFFRCFLLLFCGSDPVPVRGYPYMRGLGLMSGLSSFYLLFTCVVSFYFGVKGSLEVDMETSTGLRPSWAYVITVSLLISTSYVNAETETIR